MPDWLVRNQSSILKGIFVLLLVTLAYHLGSCNGAKEKDIQRLEANVELLDKKRVSDRVAAEDRLKETLRHESERTELERAVNEAESKGVDPRTAYYDCVRLQQQARKTDSPSPSC